MTRKTLVVLAILAIALVVLVISTDAMRGGMRGGSGGMGGSGGGISPVPDGNYGGNYEGNYDVPSSGCGSYVSFPDNYNSDGNYDPVEVCISTDKRMYAEGEPIEITVTAHNPTTNNPLYIMDDCALGSMLTYTVDEYIGQGTFVDENGTVVTPYSSTCLAFSWHTLQPGATESKAFIRYSGTNEFGDYVPLPVGIHSVVGKVRAWAGALHVTPLLAIESDPITIRVIESDAGHMDGGNYGNGGNYDGNYEGNYDNIGNTGTVSFSVNTEGTIVITTTGEVVSRTDGGIIIYAADTIVEIYLDPTTCELIYTINGVVNTADNGVLIVYPDGPLGIGVAPTCELTYWANG